MVVCFETREMARLYSDCKKDMRAKFSRISKDYAELKVLRSIALNGIRTGAADQETSKGDFFDLKTTLLMKYKQHHDLIKSELNAFSGVRFERLGNDEADSQFKAFLRRRSVTNVWNSKWTKTLAYYLRWMRRLTIPGEEPGVVPNEKEWNESIKNSAQDLKDKFVNLNRQWLEALKSCEKEEEDSPQLQIEYMNSRDELISEVESVIDEVEDNHDFLSRFGIFNRWFFTHTMNSLGYLRELQRMRVPADDDEDVADDVLPNAVANDALPGAVEEP